MPAAPSSSAPTAPPLVSVVYVVALFDPRKWVGAVFAILGVVASVVVPFLPTGISKRLVRSETTIIVPRRQHGRNASQMTEISSSTPTPVVHAFAPQSVPPKLPHHRHSSPLHSFTQRPPHRRSITPESSSRAYLSNPISETDPSPSLYTRQLGDAINNSNNKVIHNLTSVFPPAHTIYRHHRSEPRRSLESLDLATPANPQPVTSSPHPSTITKVTFHVPDSYSHRRTSTDYFQNQNKDGTISTASGAYPTVGGSELGQYWRGNGSFAVKRSTTLPTQTEPLPARRKFSLFSRDRDIPPQPSKNSTSRTLLPNDVGFEPSPPSGVSLSGNPLSQDFVSPEAASDNSISETTPIERFSMPPERARRTDPYKQFNIPVPGTERAKAFLRAEKEWVKAETKRRELEKANRALEEAAKPQASEILTSKGTASETEKQKKGARRCSVDRPRLKQPSFPNRKSNSTDEEALLSAGFVETGNEIDLDDRDYEGHRQTLPILDIPDVDEFGVLPAPLSAVPEEDHPVASSSTMLSEANMSEPSTPPSRPSSAQGKRVWVFLKRPESRGATAKKSKEDQPLNNKSKRPKSRDAKAVLPFGSGGKKEGGYVSDTAVTSLTYQLM